MWRVLVSAGGDGPLILRQSVITIMTVLAKCKGISNQKKTKKRRELLRRIISTRMSLSEQDYSLP